MELRDSWRTFEHSSKLSVIMVRELLTVPKFISSRRGFELAKAPKPVWMFTSSVAKNEAEVAMVQAFNEVIVHGLHPKLSGTLK